MGRAYSDIGSGDPSDSGPSLTRGARGTATGADRGGPAPSIRSPSRPGLAHTFTAPEWHAVTKAVRVNSTSDSGSAWAWARATAGTAASSEQGGGGAISGGRSGAQAGRGAGAPLEAAAPGTLPTGGEPKADRCGGSSPPARGLGGAFLGLGGVGTRHGGRGRGSVHAAHAARPAPTHAACM